DEDRGHAALTLPTVYLGRLALERTGAEFADCSSARKVRVRNPADAPPSSRSSAVARAMVKWMPARSRWPGTGSAGRSGGCRCRPWPGQRHGAGPFGTAHGNGALHRAPADAPAAKVAANASVISNSLGSS